MYLRGSQCVDRTIDFRSYSKKAQEFFDGAERKLIKTANAGIRVADVTKQIGKPMSNVQAIDSIPG